MANVGSYAFRMSSGRLPHAHVERYCTVQVSRSGDRFMGTEFGHACKYRYWPMGFITIRKRCHNSSLSVITRNDGDKEVMVCEVQ